jgi:peptidoglycan hydrolase-like protein with peptidoglycan-binding domain
VQGTFRDKTEEAAKEFQSKNDLKADGKVGSKTLEMLYGEDVVSNAYTLATKTPSSRTARPRSRTWLYHLQSGRRDGKSNGYRYQGVSTGERTDARRALGPVTRDLLLSGDAQAMVLQLGDYGTSVQRLQKRLAELNYLASANATSYFGEITEDAVKAFQKRSGLTQDGKVGAVTLTMIFLPREKIDHTLPRRRILQRKLVLQQRELVFERQLFLRQFVRSCQQRGR